MNRFVWSHTASADPGKGDGAAALLLPVAHLVAPSAARILKRLRWFDRPIRILHWQKDRSIQILLCCTDTKRSISRMQR
jgi:hypothetical protein